jgi:hypothetical protein
MHQNDLGYFERATDLGEIVRFRYRTSKGRQGLRSAASDAGEEHGLDNLVRWSSAITDYATSVITSQVIQREKVVENQNIDL